MLEFLENWLDRRGKKALFRALADWQKNPARELGDFGLSITTNVNSPAHGEGACVLIRFTLHHTSGAYYRSGTYRSGTYGLPRTGMLHNVPDELDWLPDVTSPLLNEFLLPSGISDDFRQRNGWFKPLESVKL